MLEHLEVGLMSWGCCREGPQTGNLFSASSGGRSLKSRCWKVPGGSEGVPPKKTKSHAPEWEKI